MYKNLGVLMLSCLLTLPIVSQTAQAKTPAKAQVCAACHGAKGISRSDNTPNLAGQKKGYLVQTLKAFKNRKRPGPIMQGMSASLSDKDIEELANYYSKLK